MKIRLFTAVMLVFTLSACIALPDDSLLIEEGVSAELAAFRARYYEKIHYDLFFSIPEKKAEPIVGEAKIRLMTRTKQPVILDFRADEKQIVYVKANGKPVQYQFVNEHIVLSDNTLSAGEHTIEIAFAPDDQSLNRRDEFLYTLLVPDRARTLFPCFDQPDLKSEFSLKLEVPAAWQAVSNGAIFHIDTTSEQGRKTLSFKGTEPLSTYLFSFVAGKLDRVPFQREGREIAVYHRETNPAKVAQCPEIARQVFDALEWLEDYTGIPYPFAKYDLIILPGFQYGGMEHTGATLYSDRRMFLEDQPTLNEELSRSLLIAHETAHMWFGDYVTMKWFDDVWTKEVFANYFASRIVEPLYPAVNHKLNFMLDYFPSSYIEDRTAGSNPVKQALANLRDAGLVYGNIIYNKSPIILDMLVRKMGEDCFRQGICEYLETYAYGSATWEGLIAILDNYTEDNLKAWSHIWINEKGMPTIDMRIGKDPVTYTQSDSWGRGITWPQDIVSYKAAETVIPNSDGRAYGFFRLKQEDVQGCMNVLRDSKDEILRGSILITLYENLLNQTVSPEWYMDAMLTYLQEETNPLLFSSALGYIANCQRLYPAYPEKLEDVLWGIITADTVPQHCLQAFRLYRSVAESPEAIKRLFMIWKEQEAPANCSLSETDYTTLSYLLAIYLPEQADEIVSIQYERIANPDRRQEYKFISPAVSPRKHERDNLFRSLLLAKNRLVEPWAASALSYLNHRTRQQEAVGYIRPALDILQEVQRTGDIFFPATWLRSLFSAHTSPEAKAEVDKFLSDNPGYPPMLTNKIKQQSDFLYRANSFIVKH